MLLPAYPSSFIIWLIAVSEEMVVESSRLDLTKLVGVMYKRTHHLKVWASPIRAAMRWE